LRVVNSVAVAMINFPCYRARRYIALCAITFFMTGSLSKGLFFIK